MTRNQIDYQKHLETQRANRAGEELKRQELREGARHNVATEGETGRHNLVSEGLESFRIGSLDDHYRRMDATEINKLAETMAHNAVMELQGEAKIRADSHLTEEKLKNDIKSAIIRAGGTWGAAYGLLGQGWDALIAGLGGETSYDPFDFLGLSTRSTNSGSSSGEDSAVAIRTPGGRQQQSLSTQEALRRTSQNLGTRDVFSSYYGDSVLTPSGIAPAASTKKGTVEDTWYV